MLCLSTVLSCTFASGDAAVPRNRADTHPALAAACSIRTTPQVPIVLADGSTVYLNATGHATDGASIAIVGEPELVLTSQPNGKDLHTPEAPLGVITTPDGHATPIPNPVRGWIPTELRIARERRGTWRVLLVQNLGEDKPDVQDSVRFWIGRYDGRRWTSLDTIGVFTRVRSNTQYSSDLVENDGSIAFVIPFAPPPRLRGERAVQGLIFLREIGNRWGRDTLQTDWEPDQTQLVRTNTPGKWLVSVTMSYNDERGMVRMSSPFIATYGPSWRLVGRIANTDPRQVSATVINAMGTRLLATWVRDVDAPGAVEWTSLSSDLSERVSPKAPETARRGSDDYAISRMNDRTALLITRDRGVPRRTRAAVWHDGIIEDLGALEMLNDGAFTRLVPIDGQIVVLVASEIPMVVSRRVRGPRTFLMQLDVRCKDGVARTR